MKDINLKYKKKLLEIYNQPDFICKPRGLKITEKLNNSWIIDMDDPIITLPERKLSYSFMFGEAAWMLEGRNDVESVSKYVDGVKRFSDDGVTFFGAYGPKIITQTSYVVDTLIKDNDSRQGVLNIWRENPRSSKDIPCTLSLQFFLREASDNLWLHTIATMRSNDAWLGTPYDTFNFSAISFYIACCLNFRGLKCKLGSLNIQAGSRHIYENDFKKLDTIFNSNYHDESELSFNSLIEKYKDSPKKFISNLREAADYTPVSKDKERLQKIDFIKHG
jgi:thymidylate synthase